MALKILTGRLEPEDAPGFVKHINGSAVVRFNPHNVTDDANGSQLSEWGAGTFDGPPVATVSLTEIADAGGLETYTLNVGSISKAEMEVEWNTSGGAHIHAITYMVIGEA